MQKILLTGSTSYLGGKFVELYGDRFEVFGVARTDATHPIDLRDADAVERAFREFKPDIVIHTAADLGRDSATADTVLKVNPAITEHLVMLSKARATPFIFTSTEAVYGGKEQMGEYIESDPYKPRSPYGESKAKSEQVIIDSGLPYLIVRGHRFVGVNKAYHKPKQFPDTLGAIKAGKEVHLDPHKLFKPTLINNICDVFAHYIANDLTKQVIVNIGTDKATTFYNLMQDVAQMLGLNESLVKSDGEEAGWPQNSTLSTQKLKNLGYPAVTYDQLLQALQRDFKA